MQKKSEEYEKYLEKLAPDNWKPIKDKIYQITPSTEEDALPEMRIVHKLLRKIIYEPGQYQELFKDSLTKSFFLNDFFPNTSKFVLLNKSYKNKECAELADQILLECLNFYNMIFFEDNVKMSEMFKTIIDGSHTYYKVNNQDEGNAPVFFPKEFFDYYP